jgi:hypothetical protein
MKYLALTIGDWNIKPPEGVPQGGPGAAANIIKWGVNFLLIIAVLMALLFLIWGGIDLVTSEGQKDKLSRARKKIFFSIIGIVVAFFAFAIIYFVQTVFGVKFVGT